jgi:imidazolonepropionase-like amidohydrolase
MIALLALAAGPALPQEAERTTWTVAAERVWIAPGELVENGVVVIRDGKLVSVGPGSVREDDEGALHVAAVTAGMIDLSARLTPGFTAVEQSREVTPEMRVDQGLDLFDPAWKRLAASGVTTVLISPPDENVIGGLGVVLKTAGSPSVQARTLKAGAALRGAVGTQPSRRNHPAFGRADDFYSRRPTTRMGVEYVMRRAFFDAAYSQGDAARAFPGSAQLLDVLAGELPFVVQAFATQDIRTSVYLKEEMQREGFGSMNLIIDAGAEAWREPDLLVRTATAVVLPPFPWQGRTQDSALLPLNTLRVLLDRGLRVALSAHGASAADQALDDQAGFAIRGGATFDEALSAVTTTPAELIGVDARVGTLAAGKDGDCVLWNGTPFEPTSRVVGVIVDGRLVLDPRPAQDD